VATELIPLFGFARGNYKIDARDVAMSVNKWNVSDWLKPRHTVQVEVQIYSTFSISRITLATSEKILQMALFQTKHLDFSYRSVHQLRSIIPTKVNLADTKHI
jgi:hypothetical protein